MKALQHLGFDLTEKGDRGAQRRIERRSRKTQRSELAYMLNSR